VTIVPSTSAIIPKENMNVVIPNMNILGEDEVKPGLLLKAIYYQRVSTFLHNSQHGEDRDNIDHHIGTCDHMESAMSQKLDK
jgi:hypothetical protein